MEAYMDKNWAWLQLNFSLYDQTMSPVENLIYFIQMTWVPFSASLNKELKGTKEFSMETPQHFTNIPAVTYKTAFSKSRESLSELCLAQFSIMGNNSDNNGGNWIHLLDHLV